MRELKYLKSCVEPFQNNLTKLELEELHQGFMKTYRLTEEQSNDVNNIRNSLDQMVMQGITYQEFGKLMEAMYGIRKIVEEFYVNK